MSNASVSASNPTLQSPAAGAGRPLPSLSMDQAVSRIEGFILSGEVHQVATINQDLAQLSLRDPYLHRILAECSMILPDGSPITSAPEAARPLLESPVNGLALIPELARLSAQKGYGIYVLALHEESLKCAAAALTSAAPQVRIVGRSCPMISATGEIRCEQTLSNIRKANPQILLVAFGNPKQEIWIERNREALPPSVVIGLGGAFELLAGAPRQTPGWVHRFRLQTVYRMVQEPATHLPAVAARSLMPRLKAPDGRPAGSLPGASADVRVFTAPAELADHAAGLILREARAALEADQVLVLDMAATLRIEAEGIGGLLEARRVLLDAGLWIWLTNMSNPVRRVLQFSAVLDLFRLALTPTAAIEATEAERDAMRLREHSSPLFAARAAV